MVIKIFHTVQMIPDRILILIVSVSVTFIKLSITNPTELQS